jgi:hypothetical protein
MLRAVIEWSQLHMCRLKDMVICPVDQHDLGITHETRSRQASESITDNYNGQLPPSCSTFRLNANLPCVVFNSPASYALARPT